MEQFDILRFDENMKTGEASGAAGVVWIGVDDPHCRLDGFPFRVSGGPFRRLAVDPAFPEGVNQLAGHTSGGMLTFRTDSLHIRVRVRLENHARMDHMAMTGSGGFDLYLGPSGHRRFVGVTRCDFSRPDYEVQVLEREHPAMEEFQLNFPLYSGVADFALGLDAGAKLGTPAPWGNPDPVVVYGTSITQGGCASRPGRSYTSVLSRAFDRPFLNFGFSGCGKGEPEVVSAIAKVPNPALFILDYQANAGSSGIERTLSDAIDILRKAHPETPVLVLSRIRYNGELIATGSEIRHDMEAADAIAFQRDEVEHRWAEGDHHIFFWNGDSLTGPDWYECTVDGCHPTDLGFDRIAAGLVPVIRDILDGDGKHDQ